MPGRNISILLNSIYFENLFRDIGFSSSYCFVPVYLPFNTSRFATKLAPNRNTNTKPRHSRFCIKQSIKNLIKKLLSSLNMPPKRNKDVFTWTDDESSLLLSITADYRAQKLLEGIDWESVQAKYSDIAGRMMEYLRKQHEMGGTEKDYQHRADEITKEKVATKLKAVRLK